jgi:hypothetical protein
VSDGAPCTHGMQQNMLIARLPTSSPSPRPPLLPACSFRVMVTMAGGNFDQCLRETSQAVWNTTKVIDSIVKMCGEQMSGNIPSCQLCGTARDCMRQSNPLQIYSSLCLASGTECEDWKAFCEDAVVDGTPSIGYPAMCIPEPDWANLDPTPAIDSHVSSKCLDDPLTRPW